jgi:hypothetical protein
MTILDTVFMYSIEMLHDGQGPIEWTALFGQAVWMIYNRPASRTATKTKRFQLMR